MPPRLRHWPQGRESTRLPSRRPYGHLPQREAPAGGTRRGRRGHQWLMILLIIRPRFGKRLKALRAAYPRQRLWAVLEPRSNTLRRNVFERELVESLALSGWDRRRRTFSNQESIPETERMHPGESSCRPGDRKGHDATFYATADAIVEGLDASSEARVMSWLFCLMAASTASTRNCPGAFDARV